MFRAGLGIGARGHGPRAQIVFCIISVKMRYDFQKKKLRKGVQIFYVFHKYM